jgi:ferredoxin
LIPITNIPLLSEKDHNKIIKMERDIIHIDEELCDGCGDCIPNCHEGALQLIDGKATLISDLMCDGLGACIGHCPQGAITMEKREAEPYNETEVISAMAKKGRNVVLAHLQHLVDHNETNFVMEGVSWLKENRASLSFDLDEVTKIIHSSKEEMKNKSINIAEMAPQDQGAICGCPGSETREIISEESPVSDTSFTRASELRQWPVQFHLINPAAGYFKGADLLFAADCSAYTLANFHSDYLKGKSLIIACPKLDDGQDTYLQKLVQLIDHSMINTIHLLIMEVPCCGGLLRLVDQAMEQASRKVPVKCSVVSVDGKILSEEWV